MTDSRCRTEEIYWRALQITSAEARARYLEEACKANDVRRRRVEQLLTANDQAGQFLETTAPKILSDGLQPGDLLDDYQIVELLGEGGMGIVYRAKQIRGIRRDVAIKVIRPSLGTRTFEARFDIERQALARMNHPHIAKVFDAGTSSKGEPFFVMELIDGEPITEYCDRSELSLRERLEIFLPVCEAIEHAHQRGIIHRDITPRNVLVTMRDGRPSPKVIDFGVAKSLDQPLTAAVVGTQVGQWIGTPMYMSPEQIAGLNVEVDTRTDVYALGALLYELTTGHPPFDRDRLAAAHYDEMRRILLEEEPKRPSFRVQASAPVSSAVHNHASPRDRRLVRQLHEDLDWIILKALDKDRERRFGSPAEFAADIRRFLSCEPVQARPPSTLYRISKFVRRRRTAALAAALVLLSILIGSGVSVDQAVRARRAESLATVRLEALERVVAEEKAARREAETERQRAENAVQHNRLLLYLSDLKLAFQAWEHLATAEMEQILGRHVTGDPSIDLRGPEWWLLFNLTKRPDPTVMQGHDGAVREVVVLPDRKFCVSVGDDHTMRFWNLVDGTLQRTIVHGEGDLNAIAFLPGGQSFVTGKHKLTLWDLAAGEKVRELIEHDSTIESLAVSPDGRWIASAPRYDGVHVVTEDGSRLADIDTRIRNESLTFSPDGRFLYGPVELEDGRQRLRRWSVDSWTTDRDFAAPTEGYGIFALSQDGDFVAGSRTVGRRIHLHDLRHDRHLAVTPLQRTRLRDIAFSPDDQRIAGAFDDGVLRYWTLRLDWKTSAAQDVFQGPVREIPAHTGKITSVEFVDEKQLLTCGEDGDVKLWQLTAVPGRIQSELDANIARAVYAPDGAELALALQDGTVSVRDPQTGGELRRFRLTESLLRCLCYSPDGRWIAGGDEEGGITILSCGSAEAVATLHHPAGKPILDIAWSPGGEMIASIGHDGCAHLWDVPGFQYRCEIPLPSQNGDCIAFSNDGRLLACGGYFSEVLLWDIDTSRVSSRLPGVASCGSLSFSRDGQLLATGHTDGTINLWDVASAIRVGQFRSETPDVKSISFSPDDRCLISLSLGGAATVWHVASRQRLGLLHRDQRAPNTVAFSPDGRQLCTTFNHPTEENSVLLLWDLHTSHGSSIPNESR